MGVTQSIIGNVGLQQETDESLVVLDEDLFDKTTVRSLTNVTPPATSIKPYVTNPDGIGQTFSDLNQDTVIDSSSVDRLMLDITGLHTCDPKGLVFSEEMRTRQFILSQIHEAIRRETWRVGKRTKARVLQLKQNLEAAMPSLTLTAKLGVRVVTQLLLLSFNETSKKSDPQFLNSTLDVLLAALGNVAPLSLQDGRIFSPDLATSMKPLLDYLEDVACGDGKIAGVREKAVDVMLSIALARGTVADALSMVDVFQRNCLLGRDQLYPVQDFLNFLSDFEGRDEGFMTKKYEGKVVSIRTYRGKYLSAPDDNSVLLLSNDCKERELFTIVVSGPKVALQTFNGGYVRCNDDNTVTVSSTLTTAEKYKLSVAPESNDYPGFISFQTRRSTWLMPNENDTKMAQTTDTTQDGIWFQLQIKEVELRGLVDDDDDVGPTIKPEPKKEDPFPIKPDEALLRLAKSIPTSQVTGSTVKFFPKSMLAVSPSTTNVAAVAGVPIRSEGTVLGSQAVPVILAHLDRLSSQYSIPLPTAGQEPPPNNPNEVATIHKTFCINVTSRTITFLSLIVERASKHYFDEDESELEEVLGQSLKLAGAGALKDKDSDQPEKPIERNTTTDLAARSASPPKPASPNPRALSPSKKEDEAARKRADKERAKAEKEEKERQDKERKRLEKLKKDEDSRKKKEERRKAKGIKALTDAEYTSQLYTLIFSLRILKAHLYQLVRSNLPLRYFDISKTLVSTLKTQVFKLVQTPAAPRPSVATVVKMAQDTVQAEAAQILAESFEFFFPAVSEQVHYLAELLDKRLQLAKKSRRLTGSTNTATSSSSSSSTATTTTTSAVAEEENWMAGAENALLELLLTRFTSFASGALLMDELEGKGNLRDPQTSVSVVQNVFSLLLSVCAFESSTLLETQA